MARRGTEPQEAIEPALDGFDMLKDLIVDNAAQENIGNLPATESDYVEDGETGEVVGDPVALFCGSGPEVEACSRLASACGFAVEFAVGSENENVAPGVPHARKIHVVPGFEDLVAACGIDRNYFVCIFEHDVEDCELILSQCLASDALYIGLQGDPQKRAEVFGLLKEDGAPDAELAAVCCPIGLNVRASTPDQLAVGVVAELLAAKGGTLKRLRHQEQPRR